MPACLPGRDGCTRPAVLGFRLAWTPRNGSLGHRPFGIAAVSAVLALAAGAAPAVEITQCGQSVPAGEIGELRANLECTRAGDPLHLSAQGLILGRGATLNLNGFTIMGDGSGAGIQCAGCIISGPGEIANFEVAITGGGGRVRIQNVVARGNRNGMTYKAPRVIDLINVVMSDNAEIGMSARGGRVRGRDVEASRNGTAGVWAPAVKLVRLTAIGNGSRGGVYATLPREARLRLIDSTITGNNGLEAGFDVLSTGRVTLRNTTCGRGARVREHVREETTTVIGRLRCAGD